VTVLRVIWPVKFHTQQLAGTHTLTVLHCCNILYLQNGDGIYCHCHCYLMRWL